MPTPSFSPPKGTSVEELRDYIFRLIRDLNYMLSNLDDLNVNRLDAKVIVANTVTAEKMSVDELSAISANLGKVIAGILIGAYISTADGTFPRIDFSSNDNLMKAMTTATKYISIDPFSSVSVPSLEFYDGDLSQLLQVYLTSLGVSFVAALGTNINLNTGSDINLNADGLVKIDSFSQFYNQASGTNLQQELNGKAGSFSGAYGSFTTADGKTVTVSNGIITSIV